MNKIKKTKRLLVVFSAVFSILFGVLISDASAASNRITFYRGSSLAWSKDFVEWYYNGSSISSSSAWQSAGWIFPNIVRTNGITKYYTSTSLRKYRGSKTISAGVPTPWGDVNLYSSDFIDYFAIKANGSYSIN
ncbi:hypothetical protein ACQYAD_18215 [Neobacillus sp. SM06]|uniref:hypothetical protein n=1 Tax=Neobacillus sp. SM06 TaxID=3422492 RepID=UPI003D29356E